MAVDVKSPGVYFQVMPSGSVPIEGVRTDVAGFVGFTEKAPGPDPVRIASYADYEKHFGKLVAGGCLPQAVAGYFANGGRDAFVVSAGTVGAAVPAGDGSATEAPAAKELAGFAVRPIAALEPGKDVSVKLAPDAGADTFTVTVSRTGEDDEVFEKLTLKSGARFIATAVSKDSKRVRIDAPATAPTAIAAEASVTFSATSTELATTGGTLPAVVLGSGGTPLAERCTALQGSESARTGLGGLAAVDEVTMVCVPDLMFIGGPDDPAVKGVQAAILTHCEGLGDRMAILDPPRGLDHNAVTTWLQGAGLESNYVTVYWPWVQVVDPSGGVLDLPPSGHIAGIWCRSDHERGVHKAPANEKVNGIIGLTRKVTKAEHDQMDPFKVNVIRQFPGRGPMVWGARTNWKDADFKYVNIRRYINYLQESIIDGTQWCVFEPNDPALWGRIERTIEAFLGIEWRKGALFGLVPEQAFRVQCDFTTNFSETIDLGQVNCRIMVAPVKPAEFVIFELSQSTGGASITE